MSILDRVIEWTNNENSIRTVILEGSHVAGVANRFSDYDLALFCTSYDLYIKDEGWLSNIGNVWVCVHEKLQRGDRTFPTRLVIFEGGTKVDFAFYTMDILHGLVHGKSLPEEYARGYSVLVDKDSLAVTLPTPIQKERPSKKPSEREFQRIINEFWFEAYHVAIYLKRGDLWSVKFRSAAMNAFLLTVIEWEAQARLGWSQTTPPHGKRMASWVDRGTWEALQKVFAHFDADDSWHALFHALELFRHLSVGLSQQLGFDYPEVMDKNISGFILKLREGY
jgi:aminoglycoside 6-adenylyltransferase